MAAKAELNTEIQALEARLTKAEEAQKRQDATIRVLIQQRDQYARQVLDAEANARIHAELNPPKQEKAEVATPEA